MVLRVCRQILPDEGTAEDAAQATFLVFARRAGRSAAASQLGCWLHGVALRVAAKAEPLPVGIAHRSARGRDARPAPGRRRGTRGGREARRLGKVHDELGKLPESFREPLILCYLDGLTQEPPPQRDSAARSEPFRAGWRKGERS